MSRYAALSDAIAAMWWQTRAPVLHDVIAFSSHAPVLAASVARVGDPEASRTVYTTIVILTFLGVALLGLAVWVFRQTRPESELLAPLETMQTRGWRKLDPAAQRRLLDESRPAGAAPLRREASEPAVDSAFATVAPHRSFDDLSDNHRVAVEGDGSHETTDSVLDATVEARRPLLDTAESIDNTGEIPGDLDIDLDIEIEDPIGDDPVAADVDDVADLDDDADPVDDDADSVDDDADSVDEDADPVDDDADPVDEDHEVGDEDLIDDEPVMRSIDPLLAPKPKPKPKPQRHSN